MENTLEYKVKTLPTSPGVYNFLDENGTVIYVGKAKNLRSRVSSYFREKNQVGKTRFLVRHIHDLLHICVNTETDALLLENKLIKQFQPRYNILLKDDKTYPWICITHEDFPRVFFTRKKINDGTEYFGPYALMQCPECELVDIAYIREGVTSNASHRLAHRQRCQASAFAEGLAADLRDTVANYHRGQIRAALEGTGSNSFHALGDGQAFEMRTLKR